MKKVLLFIIGVGLLLCRGGEVKENLFPLPQLQENRSLGDGAGKWHRTYVGKDVSARLTVSSQTGRLDLVREGKPGVTSWRLNLVNLKPGVYTLDTIVSCSNEATMELYCFDAQGKAKLVWQRFYSHATQQPVCIPFEIPQGSVKARFGLGVKDNGVASYEMPRLYAGTLSLKQLPLRQESNVLKEKVDLLPRMKEFQPRTAQVNSEVVIDPYTGIRLELEGGKGAKDNGVARQGDGSWKFYIRNTPVDVSAAAWETEFPSVKFSSGTLFRMRYRLDGLAYTRVAYPVLFLGEEPILYSSECYSDGLEHTLIGLIPRGMETSRLKLHLRTDGEELAFHLLEFRLYPDIQSLPEAQRVAGEFSHGTQAVVLPGKVRYHQRDLLRDTLELRQKVYDHHLLPVGKVEVSGLVFELKSQWNILTGKESPLPKELGRKYQGTDLPVRGIGQPLDRIIRIPLAGKARELWLLMAVQMPGFGRNGATPVLPPQIAAHEVFSVEVVYQDGGRDWCYPYSLADQGFSLQRFTGAYALPLDEKRELREVLLHGYFRPNMGEVFVQAATLNRGAKRVIPDQVLNPSVISVTKRQAPREIPLQIQETPQGFVMENGWYRLTVGTQRGFCLKELQQKIALEEPLTMGEGGLEMDFAGETLTGGDFAVVKRTIDKDKVRMILYSQRSGVELKVVISGDQSSEIRFQATMTNRGKSRIAPRLRFPVLKEVKLGRSYEDNWIYFPKYYSLHTNAVKTYAHCPGNERAYFVQFYDAYNPKAGYGLELMTHNLNSVVLDYGLHKGVKGLKYYVQYPAPWYMLNPGESKSLAETSLLLHTDDWHQAFDLYKKWVASWYRPVKGAGLEWWRNSWVVRCEFFNKQYEWVHPIYLEKENRFRLDELRALAERRWGSCPEILHLWGWNAPKLYPGEPPRRGTPRANYADGVFDPKNYITGEKRLRELLAQQQAAGTRVSLYAIPSYLPKYCPVGVKRGKEVVRILGNGQPLTDSQCYFPCIWVWMDTFVKACGRANRSLHNDALYVDISPFPRDYTCYSPHHGHPVPLNVNLASRRLFEKMREVLPEGVAFWHEDPAADVETQWSSGCMTYYHVTGSENRAPNYGERTLAPQAMPPRQSILRFAFPKYKMFAIPIGLTNGNMNMRYYHNPIFNGEGISDSTTGIYQDRTMAVMRWGLELQRKYGDLYQSSKISPLIATEAGQIYANQFDSEDGKQTLWTLYNGRFQSYRGVVLRVPYRQGDQFVNCLTGERMKPQIEDGVALLEVELKPQLLGTILRTRESETR